MTFRVGMKVVCVNAGTYGGEGGGWGPEEKIVKDKIYTISRILFYGGSLVFHLVEVQRDALSRQWWGEDVGYAAGRFRPIVERKTDITIFTAMLTPQRIDA